MVEAAMLPPPGGEEGTDLKGWEEEKEEEEEELEEVREETEEGDL
jgi:hypothetical protein